jgi:hypothetical protein
VAGWEDGTVPNKDGKRPWVIAEPAKIAVRLDKIGASQTLNASWTDPRNGDKVTVGTVPPEGERQFAPPEKWEDAILLLESKL